MPSVKLIPKLVLTLNFAYFLGFKFSEVLADSKDLGRGYGNHIDWLTLENGLKSAKTSHKPLMLLIHKSWCSACKALKPEFSSSKEIQDLSKHFVMVNVEDGEEPKEKQFSPDGTYIPRILFLDPGGVVQTQFYNSAGNPNYKYFYSDAESIVTSMRNVAKTFKVPKVLDEL